MLQLPMYLIFKVLTAYKNIINISIDLVAEN